MKKKIWLTLGATITSLVPIAAIIACGSNTSKSASNDEIKRRKEERLLEEQAREEARKNRIAKEKKETLINNFYKNVKSSMPSSGEVKFNKFGDSDWDNTTDLANYGKNKTLDEIKDDYGQKYWHEFHYPNNFKNLYSLTPPYISPIETMTEKFITENDETQFCTLDEAISYINNANINKYEDIINWLDKKADRWQDTDDVITAKIAELNNELDYEISKDATNDLKITNLSAKKERGNLELKITLDSPIFTNADLELDTAKPLEFTYTINGSNFLHPSFKNLLNETAKIQKALNDVELKLKFDDIHLKNIGKGISIGGYVVGSDSYLPKTIDALFNANKDQRKDVWPVWTKTTDLKSALEWINDLNDFSFDNLASLPNELENYQVIGATLNWDFEDLSNKVDKNSIKLYFQHNNSPYQYYSLRLPFIVDSKIYIYNTPLEAPTFIIKDSAMWKIFEKAYFDPKVLTSDEQTKLDNFVKSPRFVTRLQEDLKRSDGTTKNLEKILIAIWDEDDQKNKYLAVKLNTPHSYPASQVFSWKKDFEPYLIDSSLNRKTDDDLYKLKWDNNL